MPHCKLAITVLAIEGNRVRLGISAPTATEVYREELWRQLCQQTHQSPAEEQGRPEESESTDPGNPR
jgi:carbon storage regulator CsrA